MAIDWKIDRKDGEVRFADDATGVAMVLPAELLLSIAAILAPAGECAACPAPVDDEPPCSEGEPTLPECQFAELNRPSYVRYSDILDQKMDQDEIRAQLLLCSMGKKVE